MASQLPDSILVNGEKLDLYSNPLEPYWGFSRRRRPRFYTSPNCKRGYIACWEIRNHELYLINVVGAFEKWSIFSARKEASFTMETLFPGGRQRPVKVTWYSGKLRVPIGRMTKYEHSGYDSRFEKEMIITLEKGNVLKQVTLDSSEKTLTINEEQPVALEGTSSLQYVVSEVQEKVSSAFAAAKVFADGSDAVRYLQRINKNKRLLVGDKELSLVVLNRLLRERLSSISVDVEQDEKKWTIAAF